MKEIAGLYDVRGELGSFLQTRFTTFRYLGDLENGFRRLWVEENRASGCKIEVVVVCGPHSLRHMWPGYPVGESFHTLIVEFPATRRALIQVRDGFLAERFPNISSLILNAGEDQNSYCIEELGANIESLSCIGGKPDSRIVTCCPHMRHLYLRRMDACGYTDMKFWEKVGAKLETLVISATTVKEISAIEKYCRKIRHLELSGRNDKEIKVVTVNLNAFH